MPLFVLGFLALSALRSVGAIDAPLAATLESVARALILVALSAVGLNVRVEDLRAVGPRPLLIGLGARDFSMNLNSIRAVSDVISSISLFDAEAMARATLALSTAGEIERLLRDQYADTWPHLFPRQFLNVTAAESK